MKTLGYSMLTVGLISAGVVGYCLLSKDTKAKANRLFKAAVNDVSYKSKKMANDMNM